MPYYPVVMPLTGGQRRVVKLVEFLRSMDHRVDVLAVTALGHPVSNDDVVLSTDANAWVFSHLHDFEMRINHALQADPRLRSILGTRIRQRDPTVIWLEHPYLWRSVREIVPSTPLILGTQNVEWKYKEALLQKSGIRDPRCPLDIQLLEEQCATEAIFVVCCSPHDAQEFKSMGAQDVVILPNGSDLPTILEPEESSRKLRSIAPLAFNIPTFSFIGSPHPPNWTGLLRFVIEPLSKIQLDSSIHVMIMGGVAHFYDAWRTRNELPANLRVTSIPIIEDDVKNAALLQSNGVLLPIPFGGGTNLKTAEALLTGHPIIATTVAFRGFEEFVSLPYVRICDNPHDFACAIIDVLAHPELQAAAAEGRLRAEEIVSWPAILKRARGPMAAMLTKVR